MRTANSEENLLILEIEGLIFEASVELDTPDKPIIFVDVLSEDRLTLQKFVISPKGLAKISKVLKDAADESEKRYEKYWKEERN